MKRSQLFAILTGLLAIVLFTADASAMYQPTLGRWAQRDPRHEYHNAYVYVGGFPIRALDPSGMASAEGTPVDLLQLPGTFLGAIGGHLQATGIPIVEQVGQIASGAGSLERGLVDIADRAVVTGLSVPAGRPLMTRNDRLKVAKAANVKCGPCCKVIMTAGAAFGIPGENHVGLTVHLVDSSGKCERYQIELLSAHGATNDQGNPISEEYRVGHGPVGGILSSALSATSLTDLPEKAWGIWVAPGSTSFRADETDAAFIGPGDNKTPCQLAQCLVNQATIIGGDAYEQKVGYDPIARSSNSFIGQLLRQCGNARPDRSTGFHGDESAPGFGNDFSK